jgi:hypothetical protein
LSRSTDKGITTIAHEAELNMTDCLALSNIQNVFMSSLEVSIDDTSLLTLHDDNAVSIRNNFGINPPAAIHCITLKFKASNIRETFRTFPICLLQRVKGNGGIILIIRQTAFHLISKAVSYLLAGGIIVRIAVRRQTQVRIRTIYIRLLLTRDFCDLCVSADQRFKPTFTR